MIDSAAKLAKDFVNKYTKGQDDHGGCDLAELSDKQILHEAYNECLDLPAYLLEMIRRAEAKEAGVESALNGDDGWLIPLITGLGTYEFETDRVYLVYEGSGRAVSMAFNRRGSNVHIWTECFTNREIRPKALMKLPVVPASLQVKLG